MLFVTHSKHVKIDIHFVRDYVANGVLDVQFVITKDQLADIITKLSSLRFSTMKNKLLLFRTRFAYGGRGC